MCNGMNCQYENTQGECNLPGYTLCPCNEEPDSFDRISSSLGPEAAAALLAAGRSWCPNCEKTCNYVETIDNPLGWCSACVTDAANQAQEHYRAQGRAY